MTRNPFKKIILGAILVVVSAAAANTAWATAGDAQGYAWSDMPDQSDQQITPSNLAGGSGAGWISLNANGLTSSGASTGYVSTTPYKVTVDDATGQWNGMGWSEHVGWIDFNPSGPYPAQPGNSVSGGAKTDWSTGKTCGWIRALAGGTPQSGGWDGWISMCGNGFGVTVDPSTGQMSGMAWGDMVMGWVDFSRARVSVNPTTAGVTLTPTPSSLVCPAGGGASSLSWSAAGVVPGSCVATGGYGFSGALPGTSGTVPVSGLNLNTTTFTITCTTAAGYTPTPTVTASTVVTCTNIPPSSPDLCSNLPGNQVSLPVLYSSGMFSPKVQYNDPNGDGICTPLGSMVLGCMDPAASNYNSAAQVDTNPSSCTYACSDPDADNYGLTGVCVYTLFCQLPQNMAPNPVPPECKKGPLSPIYNER